MAFTTADQLRYRLAGALGIAQDDPTINENSPAQTLLNDGVSWAYEEIISAFAARGLTKAQTDTWRRGAEFNNSIGLYWVLTHWNQRLPDTAIELLDKLDRRAELLSVMILDTSAEEIIPAASPSIGVGTRSTSNDLFRLNPTDTRRGQPTEW